VEKKINLQIRLLCSQGQVKKKMGKNSGRKRKFYKGVFHSIPGGRDFILSAQHNVVSTANQISKQRERTKQFQGHKRKIQT